MSKVERVTRLKHVEAKNCAMNVAGGRISGVKEARLDQARQTVLKGRGRAKGREGKGTGFRKTAGSEEGRDGRRKSKGGHELKERADEESLKGGTAERWGTKGRLFRAKPSNP